MKPDTRLIHHAYQAPGTWEAMPVAVFKGSTVLFRNTAELHRLKARDRSAYTYGLHGTPTTYTLEQRISELEGGSHTVLLPSGLAALALVNLAFLHPGDEVLLPDHIYGNNKELARDFLAPRGITHQVYKSLDLEDLASRIHERTRLIWVEAAGSISLEFPDVCAIVALARQKGVLVALDNTWGSGVAFRPFDLPGGLGVDISMQALTKYASGGADVLMGSVTTRSEALFDILDRTHQCLGFGVGANDAELVLRSLPSVHLRYRAQDESTRRLADHLQAQPWVKQVLHPAMPGSPGHEHWRALCAPEDAGDQASNLQPGRRRHLALQPLQPLQTLKQGGAACLVSAVFDPRYSKAQVHAFVDALKLFRVGYSWAGPQSLAVPYSLRHTREHERPDEHGALVRFAVGLESVQDLIADVDQAAKGLAG